MRLRIADTGADCPTSLARVKPSLVYKALLTRRPNRLTDGIAL